MLGTMVDERLTIRSCFGSWRNCWKYCVQNAFLLVNLAAVTFGIAIGLYLKICMDVSASRKRLIGIPGELLIWMLTCVSIPLVSTAVCLGAYSLTPKATRKISLCAAGYILLTTLIAASLGLMLVILFKPGAGQTRQGQLEKTGMISPWHGLYDVLRNLAPPNLFQACLQHYETVKLPIPSNGTQPSSRATSESVGSYKNGVNAMGVILYSFVAGRILHNAGEQCRIVVDLVTVIAISYRFMVTMILCYLPCGVLFMITSSILELEDWTTLYGLTKFMGVIVLGLALHSVIILPALYYLFVRRNPLTVVKGVYPALLAAWFISSSSAILPLTLRCCEERNKIDRRITRCMLPITTTINMDGTALYEAASVLFVAQFNNINLTTGQLFTIILVSVVSSLGSSGLPAAGAGTTIFVLSSVGIPAKYAIILVAMEWLLDRCNTVVNVLGDCFGVSLIHLLCLDVLQERAVQDTQWIPSATEETVL